MSRPVRPPPVKLRALAIAAFGFVVANPALAQTPPYLDTSLSFEERADDLVGRMTLEEKVSQMLDRAPAIERLGVPAYNWWNEALHGVARSGLATVFPQAMGMAATWNDSLMFRVATAISDEARAKHHEYVRSGQRNRYQGLTIWSPNINIFRDPRWGRGQETYGEDPYLTGRIATQFIRGLQGDDPTYFKTIATVKHFAVHSGPEPERHEFDAVPGERDFRETYLPHFEVGIREAGAYSLMCAYNRVYGDAACGSDLLLQDILRDEWGFEGYIVSDCGAIRDMYSGHDLVGAPTEAAALGVRSGTDLNCGNVYPNLVAAVDEGFITETQIDTSLRRLMEARFRLGMFDPPERVRWTAIPFETVDQPSHRDLALEMSEESIVLLKNEDGTLPLARDVGTIAVIGPNADEWRMLLGNYNGIPSDPVTPLRGIREAVPAGTRVLHAVGSELAEGFPVMQPAPSTVFRTEDGRPGFDVAYYGNTGMEGAPVASAVDSTVVAKWGEAAPLPDLDGDDFAVRWTAEFQPPQSGTYRLALTGTLRYRLFLDDSLVVESVYPNGDGEYPDPRTVQSEPLEIDSSRSYRIRVEGEESYGQADLQLTWAMPAATLAAEAVRAAEQADAVVMFLGLTPRLEGEEMSVQIEGFLGGDRTSIDLPGPQHRLLERIVEVGKPTILVLLTGSALAVNWADENVPAILEAWYPGQAGGTAIANVLFGEHNPAGRLPVTFYRSVDDLPAFDDYDMAGRTYRYFEGDPLYPFGHGLSYTTFQYGSLRTSATTIGAEGSATVSVDVTNTGSRAGDEVVQLYVRYPSSAVARPIRDLRGYQRVSIDPGQTRTIQFQLPASSLRYWDPAEDRWVLEPGAVTLEVGASSADIRTSAGIQVDPGP